MRVFMTPTHNSSAVSSKPAENDLSLLREAFATLSQVHDRIEMAAQNRKPIPQAASTPDSVQNGTHDSMSLEALASQYPMLATAIANQLAMLFGSIGI